jgi:hypothetical protein
VKLLPVASVLLLAACGRDEALEGAQVLVPEDVEITWDASFNREDDGVGALVPVDIMIYHGATGQPLEAVSMEVRSPWALLFRPDEVLPAKPGTPPECAEAWDVREDANLALCPNEEEISEALRLHTDPDGLARVQVWVDAFPVEDDGSFGVIPVAISTEVADEAFFLLPR